MTDRKWTPGPWQVNGKQSVRGPNGEYIAKASWKNGAAAAHLIAAAPELYEALEAALAWIDAVPGDTSLPTMPGFDRDEVDAALAKARGEQ